MIYLYLVSQWNVLFRVVGFVIIILIPTVLNQFNNDVLACLMNLTISPAKGEEMVEEMQLHACKTQR